MPAFYFDVGGVLIPGNFAPTTALKAFQQLAERQKFDPASAHTIYSEVQPSLDLGKVSLAELCARIGASQSSFEQDWRAMHPLDDAVLRLIERLLEAGYSVGLATNFCRSLLDRLIQSAPVLARLSICCSSDIGIVKPAADFFRHASEILPAHKTVFVDDRDVNVQAARQFGWTAIHAKQGWLDEFERTYLTECSRNK